MKIEASYFDDLKAINFHKTGDTITREREFVSSVEHLLDRYDAMVFYDTETTGLDPQGLDELGQPFQVIELAAMRVEKINGEIKPIAGMDDFILMNNGGTMPPSIIAFNEEHGTGITPELIQREGVPEKEAVDKFSELTKGNVLMVAYNAQFDMSFVNEMLQRSGDEEQQKIIHEKDFIDPLTVFRDRIPYINNKRENGEPMPQVWNEEKQKMVNVLADGHKLEKAVAYYSVDNYVVNSHRAIDDVKAMYAAVRKMDEQNPNLDDYIGVLGFNPKYGQEKIVHPNAKYCPQPFLEFGERRNRDQIIPGIVNRVVDALPESPTMGDLAKQTAITIATFDEELAAIIAKTKKDYLIANIEDKPFYIINRKKEAIIKKDMYPAFLAVKDLGLWAHRDFIKSMLSGDKVLLEKVNAFLDEAKNVPWGSQELKCRAILLKDYIEKANRELQLAPELKLNRDFNYDRTLRNAISEQKKSNAQVSAKRNSDFDR